MYKVKNWIQSWGQWIVILFLPHGGTTSTANRKGEFFCEDSPWIMWGLQLCIFCIRCDHWDEEEKPSVVSPSADNCCYYLDIMYGNNF